MQCATQKSALTVHRQRVGSQAFKAPAPRRSSNVVRASLDSKKDASQAQQPGRRDALLGAALVFGASCVSLPQRALADDYVTSPSGLKYFDVKMGDGATPVKGDTVVVHWVRYFHVVWWTIHVICMCPSLHK